LALPNVKFQDELKDGYGYFAIYGTGISNNILATIWGKYRKHIKRKFKTDAALSIIEEGTSYVKCYVICNVAYAERHKLNKDIYFDTFKTTFQSWINDFEQLMEAILCDEEFLACKGDNQRILELVYKYQPDIDKRSKKEREKAKMISKARHRVAQQNT
jgi:hypothetical protein